MGTGYRGAVNGGSIKGEGRNRVMEELKGKGTTEREERIKR